MARFEKGHKMSPEVRRKISKKLTGRKKSKATLVKMSLAQKGRVVTENHKRKIGLANLGKKRTREMKERMSRAQSGSKSNTWKGGITPLYLQIRHNIKTRQWSSDCFHRDDFICQECGNRGGKLHCHHIKHFAWIIDEYKIKTLEQAIDCEELWDLNNGITLCQKCHINKHKKHGTK